MGFVPIKTPHKILRIADLYNSPITGVYIKKTEGQFSPIYWLESENGSTIKIYGSKSLNSQMSDDLIGLLIRIECIDLKDIGRAYPLAIARISVWQEDQVYTPVIDLNDPSLPKPMFE